MNHSLSPLYDDGLQQPSKFSYIQLGQAPAVPVPAFNILIVFHASMIYFTNHREIDHFFSNVLLDVEFDVTALRSVEKHLGLEKLYVLGTNCGKFVYS